MRRPHLGHSASITRKGPRRYSTSSTSRYSASSLSSDSSMRRNPMASKGTWPASSPVTSYVWVCSGRSCSSRVISSSDERVRIPATPFVWRRPRAHAATVFCRSRRISYRIVGRHLSHVAVGRGESLIQGLVASAAAKSTADATHRPTLQDHPLRTCPTRHATSAATPRPPPPPRSPYGHP